MPDENQAAGVPPAEVKTKFHVFRSFSIDEARVAVANEEIELSGAEADTVLKLYEVPPIWPAEHVARLEPDEIAALSSGVIGEQMQHGAGDQAVAPSPAPAPTPTPERVEDPAASMEPKFDSNTHDSVGNPKGEVIPIGPRGRDAQPDALDEKARKALADAASAKTAAQTVTDAVDTIGNAQVEHDGEGNARPHHQHIGPRGPGAPKDTHR